MSQFTHEVRNAIAWVTFDSGAMNTLSVSAIRDLEGLIAELNAIHNKTPLKGVILKGNRHGLGAGANIGELMTATRAAARRAHRRRQHTALRDRRKVPLPWVVLLDGIALGGIYELALACHAIVATERSTVGFPEIRLNIFPGLGGTQRLPRRSGLVNATDPISGDAAITAILQGKNFPAAKARGDQGDRRGHSRRHRCRCVRATLSARDAADARPHTARRSRQCGGLAADDSADDREGDHGPTQPARALRRARRHAARAPPCPCATPSSSSAMRSSRSPRRPRARPACGSSSRCRRVQKLAKDFPGKARPLAKIGIDGIDGYMGNAIGWLALEAGYQVVGHVPLAQFAASVPDKLKAKYARAVSKGSMTEAQVAAKVGSVKVTSTIEDLFDCDLVIEARMENREIKAEFYRALGQRHEGRRTRRVELQLDGSRHSQPVLRRRAAATRRNFLNLHFFSPAEHPAMQLVEIVKGAPTTADAVATAHAFVRKINKTPVILQGRLRGLSGQRRSGRILPGGRRSVPRRHADRGHRRRPPQGGLPDGAVRAGRPSRPRHRRGHVRHARRRKSRRCASRWCGSCAR